MKTPEKLVFVALDFETSGYYPASACAIGLTRVENLEIRDSYYSLIKPLSSAIKFTHIHGLTWADLKDQRNFPAVWPEIREFIGGADFLVAHNAPFDRNVLHNCCDFFHIERPRQDFLCTLKGARRKFPLKRKSLNTVCEFLDIPLHHHRADSDARACAHIAIHLFREGAAIDDMLLQAGKTRS